MEQWNREDRDIEKIREANKTRNVSLYTIAHLAFIAKHAPPNTIKRIYEEQLDGTTEVFVEWENLFINQLEGATLPKAIKAITTLYAGERGIPEFSTFQATAKRRINAFLDTLLGEKDCVKQFFSDGFSKLQAEHLIRIVIHWDSDKLQQFCGGKYDQVGEPTKSFIQDYVYDFVAECLEDKVCLYELENLWTQRLDDSYVKQKKLLEEQIDDELNDLQGLILSCIDPKPKSEEMSAQLQFLNDCKQAIVELKEKIVEMSDYMQSQVAREEKKFEEEILEAVKEKI